MKSKQRLITLVAVISLLLVVTIFFFLIINNTSFTKTFEEYKSKANNSSINYTDYFNVEKNVSVVESKKALNGVDALSYFIRWENKTDKPISFNWQIYCEDELREKYVEIQEPMSLAWNSPLVIEPNSGLRYEYEPAFIKPYGSYKSDEIETLTKLYSKLYIEMSINGKLCYFTLQF